MEQYRAGVGERFGGREWYRRGSRFKGGINERLPGGCRILAMHY
jgi:hypothetical protein